MAGDEELDGVQCLSDFDHRSLFGLHREREENEANESVVTVEAAKAW